LHADFAPARAAGAFRLGGNGVVDPRIFIRGQRFFVTIWDVGSRPRRFPFNAGSSRFDSRPASKPRGLSLAATGTACAVADCIRDSRPHLSAPVPSRLPLSPVSAAGFRLLVRVRALRSMGKRISDEQRRTREQQDRDRDRLLFGKLGAASVVRRIDVASVDTAGLLAQLERLPNKKTDKD